MHALTFTVGGYSLLPKVTSPFSSIIMTFILYVNVGSLSFTAAPLGILQLKMRGPAAIAMRRPGKPGLLINIAPRCPRDGQRTSMLQKVAMCIGFWSLILYCSKVEVIFTAFTLPSGMRSIAGLFSVASMLSGKKRIEVRDSHNSCTIVIFGPARSLLPMYFFDGGRIVLAS